MATFDRKNQMTLPLCIAEAKSTQTRMGATRGLEGMKYAKQGSIMKSTVILLVMAILLVSNSQSWGMAQAQHTGGIGDLGGIRDLMGTPASEGGIGDMSVKKIESINKWMDNPATRTGQMKNQMAGGQTLTPSNHRFQRHNPQKVANAFAGRGAPDPAVINVARLHKIQDVAIGKMPVDGQPITPEMKKQAETILRYVRRFKRLPPPDRLPEWVDQSGPLMQGGVGKTAAPVGKVAARSQGVAVFTPSPPHPGVPHPKPQPHMPLARVAGPVLVTGIAVWEISKTETLYAEGLLSDEERTVQNGVTAVSTACGYGGAVAGAKAGAAIGIFFGPVGSVVGCVVGGVAGGVGAGYGARVVSTRVGGQWSEGQRQDDEMLREVMGDLSDPIALP